MLVPALVVVALSFLGLLDRLERKAMQAELEQRATLVAESVEPALATAIESPRPRISEKMLKSVSLEQRVLGLTVCSSDGTVLLRTAKAPKMIPCQMSETVAHHFLEVERQGVFQSRFPLRDDESRIVGALYIFQDSSKSMSYAGMLTRKYVLFAFLVLLFLVAVVTLILYRWSASRRMEQVTMAVKALLKGDTTKLAGVFENPDFTPFVKDLSKILSEFSRRKNASPPVDSTVTDARRLREEAQHLFQASQICVVANREPYVHSRKGKKIEVVRPASGLVTAMEPIVKACSGVWIGHGSGSADRETADRHGVILVPPQNPEYALKRVWLTREEEEGYYYGFANEGLWPLCHIAHTRPIFRKEDWKQYVAVNEKFASAFCDEMKEKAPIALIQDYHFASLPEMIRKRRSDAVTSLFWHIPWPNPESIRICPWKTELLEGMLGADLIGFHIQHHCNNFLDSIDSFMEARVDRENFTVTMKGHTCHIKPFPISIDWPSKQAFPAEQIPAVRSQLLDELAIPSEAIVAVGVDRMDYTKGIVERLCAVERLLEQHPELIGRFVFIQISAPSRTHIQRYQELDIEVRELSLRINRRFGRESYEPILLRVEHHSEQEVFRFYSAADLCVVTSLHDGMNLVAKEFVAARTDLGGALILSSFTGAARELKDAYVVNPYDLDNTADAIYRALISSREERRVRMSRMRELISRNNIYDWAINFLVEVHKISDRKQVVLGAAG